MSEGDDVRWHDSWLCDQVFDLLDEFRAALCLTDKAGRRSPLRRTADWAMSVCPRAGHPSPCDGRVALRSWAERLADTWEADNEVFVSFTNDHGGYGTPTDSALRSTIGKVATRLPAARDAPLALRA